MDKFENNILYLAHRYRAKLNEFLIHTNLTDFVIKKNNDNVIEYFDNANNLVKLNQQGFRCDEFLQTHNKKHVLFSGCSNTFGTGSKYEEVWSYSLYKKLLLEEQFSGYFNLGISGASIMDTITNVYRYIRKYSKPDVIFLLLPDLERDYRYLKNPDILLTPFVIEFYRQFEDYCISNNIKLISTTWMVPEQDSLWHKLESNLNMINNNYTLTDENGYLPSGDEHDYREFKFRNPYEHAVLLEKNTKTFKNMNHLQFYKKVYEYCVKNKNKPNLMETLDGSGHYGIAYHNTWSEYFYERYENEKNNI
jgi:hypothetical protein